MLRLTTSYCSKGWQLRGWGGGGGGDMTLTVLRMLGQPKSCLDHKPLQQGMTGVSVPLKSRWLLCAQGEPKSSLMMSHCSTGWQGLTGWP